MKNKEFLEDDYVRHVFITHCEADRDVAIQIHQHLEEKNFVCGLATKDFVGGVLIYNQIIKAIDESKKIVAILSKNALKSYWCTLELSLTLERTTRDDRVAIIPILLDLERKNLPDVLGQLKCIDGRQVEQAVEAICEVLKGPDVSMGNLLPVGNVGRGLAWSYFYSFLDIILAGIGIAMDNFVATKGLEKWCFSRKVNLLLPESCICPQKITDQDPDIVFVDSLRPEPKSVLRAGKPRKYNNSVYKITTGKKELYFVGEFCSVVMPMDDMEKGKIARLTADEKHRQVHTFYYTLDDILNHAFPGQYRIIRYNDKDEGSCKLSSRLLTLLEDDIRQTSTNLVESLKPTAQDLSIDGGVDESQEDLGETNCGYNSISLSKKTNSVNDQALSIESNPKAKVSSATSFRYDVCIMYGDGDCDRMLAKRMMVDLESRGKRCALKDRDLTPGGSMLTEMYEFTKRSKRIILIFSDEITDTILSIFYMLRVPARDNLGESVPPIPVLREPKHKVKAIEDFTKTMTYIDTKEVDFLDRLYKAVDAKVDVPLLPAGEIAEGFAWSYFYRYLLLVLPGLKARIANLAANEKIRGPLSHKMFLFLPKSGKMLDTVNELPGVDEHEQVTKELDVAGNVKRNYNSVIYKVKNFETKEDLYFVGEYITPLVVLKDMEEGLVAGISSEARIKQVTRLYSRLEEILSHEQAGDLKGKWRLFRYDDSEAFNSDKVCSDIMEAIREDVLEVEAETPSGLNLTPIQ